MRLLLDTHAFIWWRADSPRLKSAARRGIETAEVVYVSTATCWEIAIKVSLGRLVFPGSLADAIRDSEFLSLPIDVDHAEAVATLPAHHADPFDRMLVAQARVERLTIVSHDDALHAYGIPLLRT